MDIGGKTALNDPPQGPNMSLQKRVEHLESRIAELEAMVKKLASLVDSKVSVKSYNSSKPNPYILRRVTDADKIASGVTRELEITDENLTRLLGEVIGRYPGINFDSGLVVIPSPFSAVVHNWNRLNEQVEKSPDMQSCKDLEDLLADVKAAPELEDYFKIREVSASSNTITFETLWSLFAPKSLIVARSFMDVPHILQVADSAKISPMVFRISAWNWDWDGKAIIQVQYELEIERFQGRKGVTDLHYLPLRYCNQPESLCASVRRRSLKFIKATARCQLGAGQMLRYEGNAYTHLRRIFRPDQGEDENRITKPRADEDDSAMRLVPIRGEFMCDAQAFRQYCGECPPLGEVWGRRQIYATDRQGTLEDLSNFEHTIAMLDIEKDLDAENNNFLLLPPRLLGYALREKVWAQFNINLTKPGEGKQSQKFRDVLQLSQQYKNLIEALIVSYDWGQVSPITDVVQDKGKGLTLLLHGPPGVGKTLTAETIAESMGRPLLIIGVGDIGLDPTQAERNLEKIYSLALKWEAILLFDEADIFLESRSSHSSDLTRNALVSVLLRVLEYYNGILILTTNRVTQLDIAVQSRVNLGIMYKDLSMDQKKRIFNNFIDQMEEDKIDGKVELERLFAEDTDIIEWFERFNGRQVRNVLFSAASLALIDGGVLKLCHIKRAAKPTWRFEESMAMIVQEARRRAEVDRM